jgi:hypothetical protein
VTPSDSLVSHKVMFLIFKKIFKHFQKNNGVKRFLPAIKNYLIWNINFLPDYSEKSVIFLLVAVMN